MSVSIWLWPVGVLLKSAEETEAEAPLEVRSAKRSIVGGVPFDIPIQLKSAETKE